MDFENMILSLGETDFELHALICEWDIFYLFLNEIFLWDIFYLFVFE